MCGAGCWPRHQVSYRPPEPETEAERNFEVVWTAAREVLRDYGFELRRQDRRAGVMTTDAIVGQHFFELWRRDAATLYSYGENSVQTIFRAAKVTIHPVEGRDKFDFTLKVAVARSDKPSEQLTDASQTMMVYGGVDTSRREGGPGSFNERLQYDDLLAERALDDMEDFPLVPLGFDHRLQQRLSHKIRVAATGYVVVVPEPVEYTDPGELIPSGPPKPAGPVLPNPALPAVPPPVPNPGGRVRDSDDAAKDTGHVESRIIPAGEPSVDAPESPVTEPDDTTPDVPDDPQPLEDIFEEFEQPSPPSP
jgi:hypothetical protein